MNRLFATVAIVLLLIIVVLSVVPPDYRATTPLPHKVEHGLIFALTGLAFGFGFTTQLAVQVFGLIAFSAVVEVAQLAVPGRHARLSDFVVDALSASIGAAAAVAVRRYTERGREASRP